MDQIVTGEAVALDLRLAQLPTRMVAALLDYALKGVLLVAGFLLIARADVDQAALVTLVLLLVVAVLIGYPVVQETLWRGRTVGKAALGLRVVRDDAGPIGFRHALVRGLTGGLVESPGLFLVGTGVAVGLLVMIIHPRGKRIGDVLAGTVVIRERVSAPGLTSVAMPPPLAGWAATVDLSGLPDPLIADVRQFLGRAATLTASAREGLGGQLVAAVTQRISPPPPPGTPGWALLAAVLAERRARDERRLAPTAPPGHQGGYGPPPAAAPRGYQTGYGPPPVAAPPMPTPPPFSPLPPDEPPPTAGGFALPG